VTGTSCRNTIVVLAVIYVAASSSQHRPHDSPR
jgi:hypothetical protein